MKGIKVYQQMYRDGRMSRREFIAALGAMGLLAAAPGFLKSADALVPTPQKGGSLRMASFLHGPDDTMDPTLYTGVIDYARGRATYNNLTQLGDDLAPMPELAEEWTSNSSATEFTFKIRKGVQFHDGSPLTADDVVWTMNRHMGENSTSVIKSVMASVSEWKKVDSHTVKAVLNTPNTDLPILMGIFHNKIVQKDTKNFNKGNGTGPFVLKTFEPGVKSIHIRNENYWREGPYLDRIEITAITDPIARINALIAGDVQLIDAVDAKGIRLIEQADGVHVNSTPSGMYGGIFILKNTAPGQSDDFVKGIQYIQDRERIVRSVLKGHGSVGNDHPISAAYGKDHCASLPQRQYDPDKAKWHLNKSGYSSAELFVAPVTTGVEEMALYTQANLKKIGFDLKIKKVPSDGYWGAVWMKEPLNVVNWFMRPTANAALSIQFAPGGAWNDTYWNNDRFGELLKLSLAETNPDRRSAMYCEMQTLLHNGSGMVIPYHQNVIDGVNDKIHGIPNNPLGSLGGSEWPEFAWIEA